MIERPKNHTDLGEFEKLIQLSNSPTITNRKQSQSWLSLLCFGASSYRRSSSQFNLCKTSNREKISGLSGETMLNFETPDYVLEALGSRRYPSSVIEALKGINYLSERMNKEKNDRT